MLLTVGRCSCCSRMARVEQALCAECIAEYGERMATLIARARTHAGFAEACAARMSDQAQLSFMQILEGRPLPVRGMPRKTRGDAARNRTSALKSVSSAGNKPKT